MAMSSWVTLLVLRSLACAVAQDMTWETSTGHAPAFAPAPAAQLLPYQQNLNPIVAPSTLNDNGTDWCEPFKPCNSTAGASAESSYNLGLAPAGSSVQASAFRYASINPPTAVDWRQALQSWPVRYQGQCGSCWAFAAAGALEAAVAIATQTAQPPDLSEQQLTDCVSSGCDGGLPSKALSWALLATPGLTSETSYRYTAGNTGRSGSCQGAVPYSSSSFNSVESVPSTVLALKQAVSQQPITVAVDASDWSSYTGDLYHGRCSSSMVNHAVLLVGYNQMSTGQQYWIVRNSWGTWGAGGYIYLPIKSDDDSTGGACGILGRASGLPPVYPFKAGSAAPTPSPPPPRSASTPPPPPGSLLPSPPPPSTPASNACFVGVNPCGLGTCNAAGSTYTCTCRRGYHVSQDANGQQVCAVDGMCEYWGIELTCIVGTCVNDPTDWRYGYKCRCGTYAPSTWSVDGSPTCIRSSNTLACPTGWEVYTAEAGDQCWTIVYNSQSMTPQDFLAANPSIDCTAIFVGTQVCVASTVGLGPTSPSPQTVPAPTSPGQRMVKAPANITVSFDATLSDFYTSSFLPGTRVYNNYIAAVATAANVSSAYVSITSIRAGSVVVSTEVITKSTEASAFTAKLSGGTVFSSDTFGEVSVSSIKTDGTATTATSPSSDVSHAESGSSMVKIGMLIVSLVCCLAAA